MPRRITEEELTHLLSVIPQNSKGIRDKTIIVMLLNGITVSDISSLRLADVPQLLLNKSAWQQLEGYLSEVRPVMSNENSGDYLFLNMRGGRLSRQGLWKMIKKYASYCDVEVSPIILRGNETACFFAPK